MMKTKQLMDYLATHPDATVRFHTSDMILNVHLDASYLSEAHAHSQACGHYFMGWKVDPAKPIKLNWAFFTLCAILQSVVASAAEAELGALFLNCRQAIIFRHESQVGSGATFRWCWQVRETDLGMVCPSPGLDAYL